MRVNGNSFPPSASGVVLVPLASYGVTRLTSPQSMGGCLLDPADYAVVGQTTTLELSLSARVSRSGLTGTLVLYETSGETPVAVATLTVIETDRTEKTASVVLPVGASTYELQGSLASSTGDSDRMTLFDAVIRVARS